MQWSCTWTGADDMAGGARAERRSAEQSGLMRSERHRGTGRWRRVSLQRSMLRNRCPVFVCSCCASAIRATQRTEPDGSAAGGTASAHSGCDTQGRQCSEGRQRNVVPHWPTDREPPSACSTVAVERERTNGAETAAAAKRQAALCHCAAVAAPSRAAQTHTTALRAHPQSSPSSAVRRRAV